MSNAKNSPVTYVMVRLDENREEAKKQVLEALEVEGVLADYVGAEETTMEMEDLGGGPVIYFP